MKDFEVLDDHMLENVVGGSTYEECIGYGFSPECAALWPLYQSIRDYFGAQIKPRSTLGINLEYLGRASAGNDTREAIARAKLVAHFLRGLSDPKAAEFIAQIKSIVGG